MCPGVWVVYILSQCLRAQPELKTVPWSSHPHPGPGHQELTAHRWAPGQDVQAALGFHLSVLTCKLQTSTEVIPIECLLCVQGLYILLFNSPDKPMK